MAHKFIAPGYMCYSCRSLLARQTKACPICQQHGCVGKRTDVETQDERITRETRYARLEAPPNRYYGQST